MVSLEILSVSGRKDFCKDKKCTNINTFQFESLNHSSISHVPIANIKDYRNTSIRV